MARVLGLDHSALVRELAVNGFKTIELGGDLGMLFPHTFEPAAINKLGELKETLGLTYTLHLPLWSIETSTLHTPVRLGSVEAIIQNMQAVQPLQPEVYVMHATGALAAEFYRMRLPDLARSWMMRHFQNGARQSINSLLQLTEMPSRQLAIETVEFPLDLTLELAEEFDLSICFDTGHVLSGFSGPLDLFDALELCLPRLAEIHLHDSPQWKPGSGIVYGKDHKPLGTGDLDVVRLLDRLQSAQFTGPIIFELRLQEALASMDVVRSLRPDYIES